MDLFTYLMAKKGHNTGRDLFSYLLGKNGGGSGTYTTFSGISLNISNTVFGVIKNFILNPTELTQNGTPSPSSPVDVNVIKGSNNIKITDGIEEQNYHISLASKNLVDTSKAEIGKRIYASGVYLNSNTIDTTDYIYIGDFTKITIIHEGGDNEWNTCFFDENKNVVSGGGNGYSNSIQNINVGTKKYIKFTYLKTCKPALYGDSDLTTYEPFYNIEYCKIGDYADQIFKNEINSEFYDNTLVDGEWYLKKMVNKLILSDLTWTARSWGFAGPVITDAYVTTSNDVVRDTYSSMYVKATANQVYHLIGDISKGIALVNNKSVIIRDVDITTLENFENAISGATFYYQLETPQYIHISQEDYPTLYTQLNNIYNNSKSYNGQTNITQTNEDLPFNISVDVLVGDE